MIYFLDCENAISKSDDDWDGDYRIIKVGHTNRTGYQRAQDLQTGCPFKLTCLAELPGTEEAESALKEFFAAAALKEMGGTEWFFLRWDWLHEWISKATDAHALANALWLQRCPEYPRSRVSDYSVAAEAESTRRTANREFLQATAHLHPPGNCSECGTSLEGFRTGALTCSPAHRAKRSRRLRREALLREVVV